MQKIIKYFLLANLYFKIKIDCLLLNLIIVIYKNILSTSLWPKTKTLKVLFIDYGSTLVKQSGSTANYSQATLKS